VRARLALTLLGAALLSTPGVAYGIAAPVQFLYTGGEQTYTVPAGVGLVGVQLQGGAGGSVNGPGGGDPGGVGALLPVFPGERLFVEVGQNGAYNGGATFGGGGAAGPPAPLVCQNTNGSGPCNGAYASSGGGASDVRTCSEHTTSCPGGVSSIATRLLVGGGGGGNDGGGNGPTVECSAYGYGGNADNFQTLPGNPAAGPVPVMTAAGLVYPAPPQAPGGTVNGVTPPSGGGASGGAGGTQAGCSTSGGQESFSDSVAGSAGVLGDGGTGGNASGLPPFSGQGCQSVENSCQDAGSGGGGGGGYFGGGGGATGLDKCAAQSGACNAASSGEGGAGGSSFVSKEMFYPHNGYGALSSTTAYVEFFPAIEIDVPASGAVYSPGQRVDASWSCVAVNGIYGTLAQNCTATDASGAPISTTPGAHTFTVKGINQTSSEPVGVTVRYTVGKASSTSAHGSASGFTFALSVPAACLAPGASLHATVSKSGKGSTRVVGYALSIPGTKVRVTTKHTGAVTLSLAGLGAGRRTLKLVVSLRAGHRSHSLTLTVPFNVC